MYEIKIKSGDSLLIEDTKDYEKILKVLSEFGYEKWLDSERFSLKVPQGIIGQIRFGRKRLEIVPSIKYLTVSDYLKLSFYIDDFDLEDTGLDYIEDPLLPNALVERFFETLKKLSSEGIPPKYVSKKKYMNYFAGNVNLTESYVRNLIGREPYVYTEIEELSTEHEVVEVIKQAYEYVIGYDRRYFDGSLTALLSNVKNKNFLKSEIERIDSSFGSNERTLMTAFELAKKILLNLSFVGGEGEGSPNILLNANDIFEKFVRGLLQSHLNNYSVRRPLKKKVTESDKNGKILESRPDVLIAEPPFLTVLDVKNKNFDEYFANQDFYQIYTYCKIYGASKGILVYPSMFQTETIKVIPIFENNLNLYAVSINITGRNRRERLKRYEKFVREIKRIVDFI